MLDLEGVELDRIYRILRIESGTQELRKNSRYFSRGWTILAVTR
jgi:hypothetical protein